MKTAQSMRRNKTILKPMYGSGRSPGLHYASESREPAPAALVLVAAVLLIAFFPAITLALPHLLGDHG